MSTASVTHPVAATSPQHLLRELLRARAATLAREGQLQQAAQLLDTSDDAGHQDLAQLDLRARIHAQAGQWLEAEGLWVQVLALQPGHAGAQAALVRLRAGRQRWRSPALWAALALALLSLAVLLTAWRVSDRQTTALAQLQDEVRGRDQERLRREQDERRALDTRLAAVAEGQRALEQRLAAARAVPRPLQLGFVGPGTRQQVLGDALWIWFDADPLDGRLAPTAQGGARLRALARSVAQTQERVRVEVIAVERGSEEGTAMQRARAVAKALHGAGVLPRHAVAAMTVPGEPAQGWRGPAAALRSGAALVLRIYRVPDANAALTS